jgi:zinc finger protein
MATNSKEEPKPDGAAFDDFFDSIGKKAEHLTIDERNDKKTPATNGTTSLDTALQDGEDEANEPKIVDEIESLCMNCHENVWSSKFQVSSLLIADARELPDSSSHAYPSSAK